MAIGAVIVVIILGLLVGGMGKKKEAPALVTSAPEEIVLTPTPATPTKKPAAPAPVEKRSYTELIALYKGKTVQFGAACQVLTSTQVYKVGSEILLDNRNSVPVAIKLGANVYNLGAYGYKVVSLNTVGNFMVDCNDHQNVATVSVQK